MSGIDETHDPTLESWVESASSHEDFPIQNLPFGIFDGDGQPPRPGVAIGDWVLDLARAAELIAAVPGEELNSASLNLLFARPAAERSALRRRISQMLSDAAWRPKVEAWLRPSVECRMQLPFAIGDYTDFYAGIHHATNVGKLFRPDCPLLPNYKYVPVGYHGRASSVRPSGAPVVRPNGQRKASEASAPEYGASRRLDYELELGVWVGTGNALGTTIPIAEAGEHAAGFCLLNDWSARDLQTWEYQPLGPFLAKNFITSVSPWVITTEALEPFRIAQQQRAVGDPRPLDYLWNEADQQRGAFAVELEAGLSTAKMREAGLPPHRLSQTAAANMYWTVAQLITHHSSNGCNLNPGDLLGSGTISAASDEGLGSLLEISRGGSEPVRLSNGEIRCFLEDGDELILGAKARIEGRVTIGFGECRGIICAAPPA